MKKESGESILRRIEASWARGEAPVPAALAFDGDGTLWSGDVGEDFFHALVARGDFRPEARAALLADAAEFAIAVPPAADRDAGVVAAKVLYAAYLDGRYPEERTCEMMTWACAGWSRAEVATFARELVLEKSVEKRMHLEARRVVEWARGQGLTVILVSASPREIVEAAGALLDFAPGDVVAATARYASDVMCAEPLRPIPYGAGKVHGLRARLGATPLLAAFGDNAFDVAMLREAYVPVAVRPKDRLRARAADVPGLVEIDPEV